MSKTGIWFKALLATAITGAANSGLAVLGISAADALGVPIAKLDWKQVLAVCASGAFVGLLAYLKKSPVPNGDDDQQGKLPLPAFAMICALCLCSGCSSTSGLLSPSALRGEISIAAQVGMEVYPQATPGVALGRDALCAAASASNALPAKIVADLQGAGITNSNAKIIVNGALLAYQTVLNALGTNNLAKAQPYLDALCGGLTDALPPARAARIMAQPLPPHLTQ